MGEHQVDRAEQIAHGRAAVRTMDEAAARGSLARETVDTIVEILRAELGDEVLQGRGVASIAPMQVTGGAGERLTLFQVDEGSATTWVLAVDEDDVVRVLLELHGYTDLSEIDGDLGWQNGRPLSIEAVAADRAERMRCTDEDGSQHTSMADECRRSRRRRAVASTEW